MITAVYRQGRWQAHSVIADRGQEFGDGVFETLRLVGSDTSSLAAPLWSLHRARLAQGLVKLNLPIHTLSQIDAAMTQLGSLSEWLPELLSELLALKQQATVARCDIQAKLLVSRQSNQDSPQPARGYHCLPAQDANIQLSLRLAPMWQSWTKGWKIGVNPVTLSEQPRLAGIKHLNRLEQVLACQAFQPDWQESLMLNQAGDVIEACMSNVFVIDGTSLITPLLDNAGVNGVARRWLLANAERLGLECLQGAVDVPRIQAAEGLLLCNSLNGFSWVAEVDDFSFTQNKQRVAQSIQQICQTAFFQEFHPGEEL